MTVAATRSVGSEGINLLIIMTDSATLTHVLRVAVSVP